MYKTKNQIGWEEINKQSNLINKIDKLGEFKISSTKIKKIAGREPRLMAKFDHSENRPKIFLKNDISILPIGWRDYVLLRFNSYKNVNYSNRKILININLLKKYETIDPKKITSEDNAIIISQITNMISHFLEDDVKLTTRGKFGTGDFDFFVDTNCGKKVIKVNNTGAELDAGFEGNKFYVLEAKLSKIDNFNIRQLYYPYRFWKKKINKEIIPIFFTYFDGMFSFWKYKLLEENNFNSLSLIKHCNYIFEEEIYPITNEVFDIREFLPSDYEDIPFPQADDFEKVINVLELTNSGINTKEDFADYFSFRPRQSDYYFNAAKYLGLLFKEHGIIQLTENGNKLVNSSRTDRHKALIKSILKHKVFYDCYQEMNSSNYDIEKIIEIMSANSVLEKGSGNTIKRRAQTIISWCIWIKEKIEESKNGGNG